MLPDIKRLRESLVFKPVQKLIITDELQDVEYQLDFEKRLEERVLLQKNIKRC
ncbi:MAG TPA: hypothetical protein PLG48_01125 [Candidatus Avimonas sp.]|nr:hypothetical protein [Clostridiales bacterium]HPU58096.1 hypothetical protein [Candidatus Avimonas sp.]